VATSSASLDRSPRKNWVENSGGLPPGIRKVARAIKKRNPSWSLSRCIATAQSMSEKWAARGSAKGARNVAGMKTLQARNRSRQVSAAHPAYDGMLLALSQSYGADVVPSISGQVLDLAAPVDAVTAETIRLVEQRNRAKGKFDEKEHPRAAAGSPTGGQFVPAGKARDEKAAEAQKDPKAAEQSKQLQEGKLEDLGKLPDGELQALSRYLFSWKSSDPTVVKARVRVTAALAKRGMDVREFGSRAGRPTPRPAEVRASTPASMATWFDLATPGDVAQWLDLATERRVRTPAGVKRYGKPIGAVITAGSAPKVRTGADYVRSAQKARATREQRAGAAADRLAGLDSKTRRGVLQNASNSQLAQVEQAARSRSAVGQPGHTDVARDIATERKRRASAQDEARKVRRGETKLPGVGAQSTDDRLARLTPEQREAVLAVRAKRKAQREAAQQPDAGAAQRAENDRVARAQQLPGADGGRPTPDMSNPERLSDAELDAELAQSKVRLRAAFEADPRRTGQGFADAKLHANVLAAEKRRRNEAQGARSLPPTPAERAQARLAEQQRHTAETSQRRADSNPTPAAVPAQEVDRTGKPAPWGLSPTGYALKKPATEPRGNPEVTERMATARRRPVPKIAAQVLTGALDQPDHALPDVKGASTGTGETLHERGYQEWVRRPNGSSYLRLTEAGVAKARELRGNAPAAGSSSSSPPDADALLGMPSAAAQQAAAGRMSVAELRAVDDELTRRGSVSAARRAVAERLAATVDDRRPLDALAADERKQSDRRTAGIEAGAAQVPRRPAVRTPQEQEQAVRDAYSEVAASPGDIVSMHQLRDRLAARGIRRADQDAAIERLMMQPGVAVWARSDQGNLTASERRAAVRIGGEDRHSIMITPTEPAPAPRAQDPRAVAGTPENIAARQQARARGAAQPSMFAGEEDQRMTDDAVRRRGGGSLFDQPGTATRGPAGSSGVTVDELVNTPSGPHLNQRRAQIRAAIANLDDNRRAALHAATRAEIERVEPQAAAVPGFARNDPAARLDSLRMIEQELARPTSVPNASDLAAKNAATRGEIIRGLSAAQAQQLAADNAAALADLRARRDAARTEGRMSRHVDGEITRQERLAESLQAHAVTGRPVAPVDLDQVDEEPNDPAAAVAEMSPRTTGARTASTRAAQAELRRAQNAVPDEWAHLTPQQQQALTAQRKAVEAAWKRARKVFDETEGAADAAAKRRRGRAAQKAADTRQVYDDLARGWGAPALPPLHRTPARPAGPPPRGDEAAITSAKQELSEVARKTAANFNARGGTLGGKQAKRTTDGRLRRAAAYNRQTDQLRARLRSLGVPDAEIEETIRAAWGG
jgi:hypothetical protein